MKFKLVLLSLCFLYSSSCFAIPSWENAKIKQIITHDNGTAGYKGVIHVIMHTDMPDTAVPASGCMAYPVYKSRFIIDLSRDTGSALLSTALAAYMGGKDVTVTVNDLCAEGIPLVRNIYLGS